MAGVSELRNVLTNFEFLKRLGYSHEMPGTILGTTKKVWINFITQQVSDEYDSIKPVYKNMKLILFLVTKSVTYAVSGITKAIVKQGFINLNGVLFTGLHDKVKYNEEYDLIFTADGSEEKHKEGYMDMQGKYVSGRTYQKMELSPFTKKFYLEDDGLVGYMHLDGKLLTGSMHKKMNFDFRRYDLFIIKGEGRVKYANLEGSYVAKENRREYLKSKKAA